MSEESRPLDAYQPPLADVVPAPAERKSGWLKAISIIAVVLGALGVLGALMGIVGLALSSQLQGAFAPPAPPGMPQEMVDLQNQMQAEIQAIQERFWVANLTMTIIQLVVSGMLLVGGIQCLMRSAPGRKVLLTACSVAIVFEIVRAVVQTLMQVQTASVTQRFMQGMFGNEDAQAAELMATFGRAAIMVGVCFGLMWVLVKLVYYILAIRTLRKPEVRAQLGAPAGS